MNIYTKLVIDIETDRVLEREGYEYHGPLAQAVAATAVSKVASFNMYGGILEVWRFTVDPGSIAAAAQEIETVAVTGARVGDPCWVSLEAPVVSLNTQGAKVTASDVVSVYLENNITVTTALDSVAVTGIVIIIKMGLGS